MSGASKQFCEIKHFPVILTLITGYRTIMALLNTMLFQGKIK